MGGQSHPVGSRQMAKERFFQSKKNIIVALRFLVLASLLVIVWFQKIEGLPGWLVAATIVILAASNIGLIVIEASRKKAQEAQLEKVRVQSQLIILSSLSGAMSSPGSFRQIINKFASASEPVLSFTGCATLDLGEAPHKLQLHLTSTVSREFVEQVAQRMTESLSQVLAEPPVGKMLAIEYDRSKISDKDTSKMQSFLAVPVVVENETLALIGFASIEQGAFKPEDISFAYTLANYYSLILSRARVEEEMLRLEVEDQLQRERLELEAARKEAEAQAARTALEMERKALRELRRVDQLKSEFITTVSHEMRTPMTSIKSSMDLLLSGRLGEISKKNRQFLEIAVRNIDRLAQLIDDALNISRLESGKHKLTPGLYEMKPVLEKVLGALEPKLSEKNAQVADKIPADLRAFFDKNSLAQVFTNLITNASNHNEPGVKISVKMVAKNDEMVTLSVADDGVGIAEDEREKVFERFFQAGRTYGEGPKGTGLGLTISKSLVKVMGGKIWVESAGGQGADFRFTLPLSQETAARPTEGT